MGVFVIACSGLQQVPENTQSSDAQFEKPDGGDDGSSNKNSAYHLRETLIYITQFFCFIGPVFVVVFQLLFIRKSTIRQLPRAIRPFSDEGRDSRKNTWVKGIHEGTLDIMLKRCDVRDFEVLNRLFVTSPATTGLESLQDKRRLTLTPASWIRTIVSNNWVQQQ